MQIVFSHYHLNAAGVTQVILNQLRSLASLKGSSRPERVGVLYGGRHDGWPDAVWNELDGGKLETVLMPLPTLDYSQLPTLREEELADEVAELLASHGFMHDNTLLHLHNHSLGKNVSWPGAVQLLAKRGYRQLLQIHDFVEDFRPSNYRHLATSWHTDDPTQVAAKQYPTAAGIHYATLSSRDESMLASAGIESQRIHQLPNPVAEFHGLSNPKSVAEKVRDELQIPRDSRLVLYPVRGIRRKNLGELLLHAAVSEPNTWHALTLAPTNPIEIPSYERWQRLSESLGLRCLFNVCGGGSSQFLDTLAASDALITTSVAEGFGMVYLEAWLADKSLVGRDLPAITCDFKQEGLQLDNLYETLQVPLDLVGDRSSLAETLLLAYEWACESYGVPPTSRDETLAAIDTLLSNDTIDFALLPSRFQELVIRRVAVEPELLRESIASATHECDAAVIEQNAKLAREHYSLAAIVGKLAKAYKHVAKEPAPQAIQPAPHGARILDQFLRVDRLHAIRFEE
ncbi:glycosyltransferase family protein [Aeoliella mucimassa]|uniref:Glycosyl transferases group 1 n=1 Tax=Aeoliella mucimassa TaxID=2527972 RepID=A0A518AUN8_9BACT|nr:glycosyltransferase family 4 protein [Aeoliella mucimassa]QDU58441.1 hypothetical protein Pan181_46770 [Aeoliella mucimassa]